jgi:hypothetical protein
MKISNSKIREEITDLVEEDFTARYYKFMDENNYIELIKKIKGIQLIEERKSKQDYSKEENCIDFVFRNSHKFKSYFFIYPSKFLLKYFHKRTMNNWNYKLTENIDDAEIIVYGTGYGKNKEYFYAKHFGKVNNGKVISKFSLSHIFEHDVDLIPTYYGNDILLWKKQ